MLADKDKNNTRLSVYLPDDLMAAVVGWREANDLTTNADAVSELVRLGLLSEISKAHEFVVAIRSAAHIEQDGRLCQSNVP